MLQKNYCKQQQMQEKRTEHDPDLSDSYRFFAVSVWL